MRHRAHLAGKASDADAVARPPSTSLYPGRTAGNADRRGRPPRSGFDRWPEPPTGTVEIAELLQWHGWWAELEAAPTAAAALDIFVTNGVAVLQRVGPLITAMHGATGDSPAAEVVSTAEERRVDSYREVVRVIAGNPGGLRRGMSTSTATDVVVVLFSAELHQALAVGRGWSHRRCVGFFREVLTAQLLGTET